MAIFLSFFRQFTKKREREEGGSENKSQISVPNACILVNSYVVATFTVTTTFIYLKFNMTNKNNDVAFQDLLTMRAILWATYGFLLFFFLSLFVHKCAITTPLQLA